MNRHALLNPDGQDRTVTLAMPNIKKKSCERFLSVDELRALLSQASAREHLVLRILAVCGLRPAEVLVLRIEDFERTQLRIDEALKERQRGEDRIGTTKTAESDNYVSRQIWPARLRRGSGGIPIGTIPARSSFQTRLERLSAWVTT